MNVYGAGLPRTGTTMLAQCLSVVRETHHECPPMRGDGNEPIRGVIRRRLTGDKTDDLTPFIGHGSEVAFWYSYMLPDLPGKYVALWRPYSSWMDAALRFDLLAVNRGGDRLLDQYDYWEGDTQQEKLRSMWVMNTTHLLSLDTYVTTAERTEWSHLLDWLGWDYTQDDLAKMRAIQRSRPNAGTPAQVGPSGDAETDTLERELEARTPFQRLVFLT